MNYPTETDNKQQLNSLLLSYNLFDIVKVPTRIYNISSTITDNTFVDCNRFKKLEIIPITLVNKDFIKCLILADYYVFLGVESEYELRICPNGFIFVTATNNF
jgi:hypothetical protein